MIQDMVRDKVSAMRNTNSDDLLAALGLERRRSSVEMVATTAAVLAVGMAIGAGVALLMAPKSGRALRQDLRARANEIKDRVGERADEAARELRSTFATEDSEKRNSAGKPHENTQNAQRRT